jgi:hypothetical protein
MQDGENDGRQNYKLFAWEDVSAGRRHFPLGPEMSVERCFPEGYLISLESEPRLYIIRDWSESFSTSPTSPTRKRRFASQHRAR